jgi:gamma-tubulin complex component 5
VDSKLRGLIEKFQVLRRDDLSDGLEERLKQLSSVSNRWTPEVLSLLLQLSDQPVKKAGLYDPHNRSDTPAEKPLTWAEILADDPTSDEDLWLEPSYSPISSDSEEDVQAEAVIQPTASEATHTRKPTQHIGNYLIQSNDAILQGLSKAQYWTPTHEDEQAFPNIIPDEAITVPELHIIRETILMLRGLPTSLFHVDQNGLVYFEEKYSLHEISKPLLSSVMRKVATAGSKIGYIRSWSERPQSDYSLQRFQAVVTSRIKQFSRSLDALELSFAALPCEKVVSLIDVAERLAQSAQPLLQLEYIISKLTPNSTSPFLHLELLYNATCMHQAAGDDILYEYMGTTFFEALTIYLRTIRHWMQRGELDPDDYSFFITMSDENPNDSSLWHDKFFFRKSSEDTLLAPKFTEPAATRILNAGKSIIFLNRLGIKPPEAFEIQDLLSFDGLLKQGNASIAPFASLFQETFEEWIHGNYSKASSILRQQLFSTYSLNRNLAALQEIYFCSDGSKFQAFADPIFDALDRRMTSWNDCFLLLERIQSIHRTSSSVETERLSIRNMNSKASARSVKALSSVAIDYSVSSLNHMLRSYMELTTNIAILATTQCHSKIVPDHLPKSLQASASNLPSEVLATSNRPNTRCSAYEAHRNLY